MSLHIIGERVQMNAVGFNKKVGDMEVWKRTPFLSRQSKCRLGTCRFLHILGGQWIEEGNKFIEKLDKMWVRKSSVSVSRRLWGLDKGRPLSTWGAGCRIDAISLAS